MSRTRIIRVSLGFVFIALAVLVAPYEAFFDDVSVGGIELSENGDPSVVASCDPEIVEKLMSEEPLHIRKGDTLNHVLKCANIPLSQISEVIKALRPNFNPRNLNPQHEVMITTSPSEKDQERTLLSLTIRPSFEEEVIVSQQEDGSYISEKKKRQIKNETKTATGSIQSSLYIDAANQGVPGKILHQMIRILSYQVDFQRSVQSGDEFEVMYEIQTDEESNTTVAGELLYACLKIKGVPIYIYRFESKNGEMNYYNEKGESVKKALLQTPVDGARISSGFGNRHHPVLGYTKMHTGVDFAVPTGTPIMAAGDGVVEKAGWFGGYGKYVCIRHNGSFKTAYAHLSRYAKGLRVGKRVKQGDTIGYSGRTGRTTGPHLHYEVIRDNRKINPRSIRNIPGSSKLTGELLKQFQTKKSAMDKLYLAMSAPLETKTQLAQAKTQNDTL